MTPEQLKNSILQYAMEGKLVKQDPTDEPASVLLEKIKVEKAKLIKEGKIKRTKKLPEIQDDEKPFDMPDSWEWVRIGQISFTQTGTTPSHKIQGIRGSYIPFIKPGDIFENGINYANEGLSKLGLNNGRLILKGSVLVVCIGGSIGKAYFTDRNVSCNQQINTITPIFNDNPRFLWACVTSKYFQNTIIKNSTGSATPIINKNKFDHLLLPFPPFEEQKRIVAKIEKLMPLVDEYAKAYNRLQKIDDSFDEKLKQSILQYAMEGKLVKQDPTDEPASVLLKKIKAEKAKLVKEGKIKKTKKLPEIQDDEKPFDIPGSWEWVRLGDVGYTINGDRGKNYPGRKYWVDEGVPFINAAALKSEKIIDHNNFNYITQERYNLLRTGLVKNRDILYCLRGSVGKSAICDIDKGAIASSLIIFRSNFCNIDIDYIYYGLNSSLNSKLIEKYGNGTAQPNIPGKALLYMLIPLPPVGEQKRIVAKIEKLMSLIDEYTKTYT